MGFGAAQQILQNAPALHDTSVLLQSARTTARIITVEIILQKDGSCCSSRTRFAVR